jgi:hypothetical protein
MIARAAATQPNVAQQNAHRHKLDRFVVTTAPSSFRAAAAHAVELHMLQCIHAIEYICVYVTM